MLAAAAAVATTGAAPLFAQEEKQSPSPNEKMGVAVVGVNGRGGTHIGAFANRKDTEILYVCDVDSGVGEVPSVYAGPGSEVDQGTPVLSPQPRQKLLAERLFPGLEPCAVARLDLCVISAL